MRLLAIDPGERWVGVASLRVADGWVRAMSMVVDRTGERDIRDTVDFICSWFGMITVVVENYQQRNVGHQRFSGNETLRLIGALQYVSCKNSWEWGEVMPGNPDHELPELPLWPILKQWRTMRRAKNVAWRHCDSAWRIGQRWLLSKKPTLAAQLYRSRQAHVHETQYDHDFSPSLARKHLFVPSIEWRLKR
jgi:hypothetical protein